MQKKTDIDDAHFATEDYEYDECGNVTKKTLSGNLDTTPSRITEYEYYNNNLLKKAKDNSPNSVENPNYNSGSDIINYYDKDNNLIKVENIRDGSNTDVLKYSYDNRDRKKQSIKLVVKDDVYDAASLPNYLALLDPDDSDKIQLITGYWNHK